MKSIYVGNLPFSAKEDEIRDLFATYGEVQVVKFVMDRETGRSKGFGFVTFATDEAAAKCKTEMDGQIIDGRAVKIDYPREREERGGGGGGGGYDRGPRRF